MTVLQDHGWSVTTTHAYYTSYCIRQFITLHTIIQHPDFFWWKLNSENIIRKQLHLIIFVTFFKHFFKLAPALKSDKNVKKSYSVNGAMTILIRPYEIWLCQTLYNICFSFIILYSNMTRLYIKGNKGKKKTSIIEHLRCLTRRYQFNFWIVK